MGGGRQARNQRRQEAAGDLGKVSKRPESPGWGMDMKPRRQPPVYVLTPTQVKDAAPEADEDPVAAAERRAVAEAWHRRGCKREGVTLPPAPWAPVTGGATKSRIGGRAMTRDVDGSKKGDKGELGDRGADGRDGKDGEHGEKGEKGDTGDRGAAGKDGVDGKDRKNGDDGKDGKLARMGRMARMVKTENWHGWQEGRNS